MCVFVGYVVFCLWRSCLHTWERFPLRGGALGVCVCVRATERGIWWIMEQMWSVLGFSPSLGLVLTLSSSLSLAAASLSLYSSTFTSVRHFSFSVRCCFPFIWFPSLSCSSFHVSSLFPSVLLCRLMLSLKSGSFARALVTWRKIESRRRKGYINFCKSFRALSVPRKAVSLLPSVLPLSVWFT